jgi:Nucleotidyltransferase
MSRPGDADLLTAARSALLDALQALQPHLHAVIVIGAQAIYLHTGAAQVALAETTKDSDLALDTRALLDIPLLEDAMLQAGFRLDPDSPQPGSWLNREGIPVDLMVPESLAGTASRRGARIPPHSKHAARRANGLEAAIVDHTPMRVAALDPNDPRTCTVNVASPAALLVAKLHKIAERAETPDRLLDKDAHDLYRLLVAIPTNELATALQRLRDDALAGETTRHALGFLHTLFADGPEALGSMMAGRAEQGIGDPLVVSTSAATLAADLFATLHTENPSG